MRASRHCWLIDEQPSDIDPQEMLDERDAIIEKCRTFQSAHTRWLCEAYSKIDKAMDALQKSGDKRRAMEVLENLRGWFKDEKNAA